MPEHRRLAAIMFTDMVGYSALSQQDERRALRLLDEQRAVLRAAFDAHGGKEIEAIGDGFFVKFGNALGAAQCAVDIQRRLHERNAQAAPGEHIRVRIGLHLGDVVVRAGRVHGDGVNIAARIEPLAGPGGICMSEDVARQIQNKVELPLLRLGRADLKNIELPVEIYRVVLPWDQRRLPGMEPVAFAMRHRRARRSILGAAAAAGALGAAGLWWSRGTQPDQARSNHRIAVLPFLSVSANAQDEYFVEGMTEEIIARLSKVRGLEVIARTSIAAYKGTTKPVREIGTELNVGSVLEGSVRRAGSQVRVTAQLIDVARDTSLWSSEYDRKLEDIFALQRDIAEQVARALTMTLPVAPPDSFEVTGTQDLDAYSDYLRARFYANKGTRDDFYRAISYFEQAIARAPSYALAYAGMADAYGNLTGYERAPDPLYLKARAAAAKALELDPSLAEAHSALGVVKAFYEHDLPGAEKAFVRALELNPSSVITRDWYSFYLLFYPRWDEAIAMQRRAVQLDPLSILINADMAWVLSHAGRWDEAIEHLRRTLELDPGNRLLLGVLGLTYLAKGLHREAMAAYEKRRSHHGMDAELLCGMAQAQVMAGDLEQARRMVEEAKSDRNGPPAQSWSIAGVYRRLAEKDARYEQDLFYWLNVAYEEHSLGLVFVSSVEWSRLRSDPRMIALRGKLGLRA
jgi:TolB-like protein/Tfp pilus assembly protein PilF